MTGRVVITYDDGSTHKSVQVSAEFTGWQPSDLVQEAGTLYTAEFRNVEPHREYMYKFLVDGNWTLQEGFEAIDDGNGNLNHKVIAEPFNEPASAASHSVPHGSKAAAAPSELPSDATKSTAAPATKSTSTGAVAGAVGAAGAAVGAAAGAAAAAVGLKDTSSSTKSTSEHGGESSGFAKSSIPSILSQVKSDSDSQRKLPEADLKQYQDLSQAHKADAGSGTSGSGTVPVVVGQQTLTEKFATGPDGQKIKIDENVHDNASQTASIATNAAVRDFGGVPDEHTAAYGKTAGSDGKTSAATAEAAAGLPPAGQHSGLGGGSSEAAAAEAAAGITPPQPSTGSASGSGLGSSSGSSSGQGIYEKIEKQVPGGYLFAEDGADNAAYTAQGAVTQRDTEGVAPGTKSYQFAEDGADLAGADTKKLEATREYEGVAPGTKSYGFAEDGADAAAAAAQKIDTGHEYEGVEPGSESFDFAEDAARISGSDAKKIDLTRQYENIAPGSQGYKTADEGANAAESPFRKATGSYGVSPNTPAKTGSSNYDLPPATDPDSTIGSAYTADQTWSSPARGNAAVVAAAPAGESTPPRQGSPGYEGDSSVYDSALEDGEADSRAGVAGVESAYSDAYGTGTAAVSQGTAAASQTASGLKSSASDRTLKNLTLDPKSVPLPGAPSTGSTAPADASTGGSTTPKIPPPKLAGLAALGSVPQSGSAPSASTASASTPSASKSVPSGSAGPTGTVSSGQETPLPTGTDLASAPSKSAARETAPLEASLGKPTAGASTSDISDLSAEDVPAPGSAPASAGKPKASATPDATISTGLPASSGSGSGSTRTSTAGTGSAALAAATAAPGRAQSEVKTKIGSVAASKQEAAAKESSKTTAGTPRKKGSFRRFVNKLLG